MHSNSFENPVSSLLVDQHRCGREPTVAPVVHAEPTTDGYRVPGLPRGHRVRFHANRAGPGGNCKGRLKAPGF